MRYTLAGAADGALTISRDVLFERSTAGELTVLSRQAAVIDESVSVDVVDRERHASRRMRVVDSRPAVIGGAVWHRLRLEPLDT